MNFQLLNNLQIIGISKYKYILLKCKFYKKKLSQKVFDFYFIWNKYNDLLCESIKKLY